MSPQVEARGGGGVTGRPQNQTCGTPAPAGAGVVNVWLLSPVEAVQVLQDEVVAEPVLVLGRHGSPQAAGQAWFFFFFTRVPWTEALTRDSTMLGLQLRRVLTE